MLKRIIDLIFAIFGCFLSLPLWILFCFLIWLEDFGWPFYLQDRVGKDGNIFQIVQFRSMIVNAEHGKGPIQCELDDCRVTKIGKIMRGAALDALPQLFNIVKGDMSFVGPRALRPQEREVKSEKVVSIFDVSGFKERSMVKPGLTGVAQILLHRDAPREQKFKYDIWYIKNQSLFLDVYLVFLSFVVTFLGKWEVRKDKLPNLTKHLNDKVINYLK